MANNWKRVKVDFKTVKLGNFIEPIKTTYSELNDIKYSTVYGVSNTDGICITGKEASKDISKYIVLKEDCFAFNPYRINVGSIGINEKGLKGCVSPAYVVFKTNENLNPYFLYHYLKSDYGNHLINWYGNRGGVRNALRFDDLCQIDIPDIDLPTQLSLLKEIQYYSATFDNLSHESSNQSTYLTKLRQAILQEAIEGKLTADWRKENPVRKGDPDYDAEALLEKIRAVKEKLIKEGKIKKQKPLAPIKLEEVLFELPEGWVWTRLGEIAEILGGYAYNSTDFKKEGINQVLRLGNIRPGKIRLEDKAVFISKQIAENTKDFLLHKNDILITMTGTRGKRDYLYTVRIMEQPYRNRHLFLNQRVGAIRFYLFSEFFEHLFTSDKPKDDVYPTSTGSANQANVGMIALKNWAIPLPPKAEQQALKNRVEKLLTMVDELEKQVSERKEQSEQLMQAVLREAFEGGK